MASGTVKFFNSEEGYGFLVHDQSGSDVFVHIAAVVRSGLQTLSEGQRVTFDIVQDRRSGKSAADNLSAE